MQKAEQARIEEERLREQLRDQELSDLRMQLEELKNRPPETETVTEVVKVENPDKVADIVKEWSPRIAYVKCSWYDSKGKFLGTANGSATLVNFTNLGIRAITSRHLFTKGPGGALPRDCKITLTNSSSYAVLIGSATLSVGKTEDWAYVTLPSDENLANITKEKVRLCKNVESGDRLLILGYPKIGSKIGLTVTDGILSGEDGQYYITSAKIDQGNSGGAAILVKDNCYLGIPSASVIGVIESLGRILKASFVLSD